MAKKFLNQVDLDSLGIGTRNGTKVLLDDGSWSAQLMLTNTTSVKVTVGTTAPASPTTGDLWIDTN